MEKAIVYCDMCEESIGEKHTKDMDSVIKIEKDKEGNVWFGDVGNWLTNRQPHDKVFCHFQCFMNWLQNWHEGVYKMKEDKA